MTDKIRIIAVDDQAGAFTEEWPLERDNWGSTFQMAEKRFMRLIERDGIAFALLQSLTYSEPVWTQVNSYRRLD